MIIVQLLFPNGLNLGFNQSVPLQPRDTAQHSRNYPKDFLGEAVKGLGLLLVRNHILDRGNLKTAILIARLLHLTILVAPKIPFQNEHMKGEARSNRIFWSMSIPAHHAHHIFVALSREGLGIRI